MATLGTEESVAGTEVAVMDQKLGSNSVFFFCGVQQFYLYKKLSVISMLIHYTIKIFNNQKQKPN